MERTYYTLDHKHPVCSRRKRWAPEWLNLSESRLELSELINDAGERYPFILVREGDKVYEFFSKETFTERYGGEGYPFPCFSSPFSFYFSSYAGSNDWEPRKISSAEALKILQPYLNESDKAAQAFVDFSNAFYAKNKSLLQQQEKEKREKENNERDSANKLNSILGEPSSTSTQSSSCYVATCVYGSYDCPEVWTLRRFRDNSLAKTVCGRTFIRIYYAVSPTLVKWFGSTKWFKRMWKGKLDSMVAHLNAEGVENTPYIDKKW